jgi:RHS repeat-associated protein
LTDPNGTTTYTWNARNQLISLSGPGVTASFQYDALGRRKSKTVNGTTTDFLYDGLNIVQELANGTPTANLFTGLGIDGVLSRADTAGARSFLTDGLGSTLALTDSTATVQTEYTYEPFGATTVNGAASANPFQYTGRENDGTELYYYRARYYHPELQRFISEEPIGFAGGDVNLYAYVGDNPVNWRDPYGLFPWLPIFTRGGGKGILSAGPGALTGGIIGGFAGAGLGTATGIPGAGFVGGLGGGWVGGKLGGLFDPPCAGELNCDEPIPAETPKPLPCH